MAGASESCIVQIADQSATANTCSSLSVCTNRCLFLAEKESDFTAKRPTEIVRKGVCTLFLATITSCPFLVPQQIRSPLQSYITWQDLLDPANSSCDRQLIGCLAVVPVFPEEASTSKMKGQKSFPLRRQYWSDVGCMHTCSTFSQKCNSSISVLVNTFHTSTAFTCGIAQARIVPVDDHESDVIGVVQCRHCKTQQAVLTTKSQTMMLPSM
mmetsp:Transcript_56319/g.93579  ORF Transcript_56319/g.93579 Transcript_56319/m.93579 type:complete len:212 (-) Transcript_56319:154-789(-)